MSRIGKFILTESGLEVTKGWVKGSMWSYCLMGVEFLFIGTKIFGNSSDSCTSLSM